MEEKHDSTPGICFAYILHVGVDPTRGVHVHEPNQTGPYFMV